jgi:hypothetical protein
LPSSDKNTYTAKYIFIKQIISFRIKNWELTLKVLEVIAEVRKKITTGFVLFLVWIITHRNIRKYKVMSFTDVNAVALHSVGRGPRQSGENI